MATIARRFTRTWEEFKSSLIPDLFEGGPFKSGRFLFRGCGDADWPLISSFDRHFAHLPTDRRLALWTRHLEAFRDACAEHGVDESILRDDRRLLAFGQHHGLPTRLLDWSLSPYVATFFAFRGTLTRPERTQHVAVWALDVESGIWSAELGVEVVAPPAIRNLRLLNQAGRFTYARTPYSTLEEYVEHSPDVPDPLLQYTLPTDQAEHALRDLAAMGVTAAHLFPDIEGMAEAVTIGSRLEAMAARYDPGHDAARRHVSRPAPPRRAQPAGLSGTEVRDTADPEGDPQRT